MKAKQDKSTKRNMADGNRAVLRRASTFWVEADGVRLVHLQAANGQDVTLCGVTLTGDQALGIGKGILCRARVDCHQCRAVVRYCQGINLDVL